MAQIHNQTPHRMRTKWRARWHIRRRPDHSWRLFLKRTVAAQLHFLGLWLALAGLVWLLWVVRQSRPDGYADIAACTIFGVSAIFVFAVSSTFHFLDDGMKMSASLQSVFENLDHLSIYAFIAGTYTVFLVNAVHPPWKNVLLIAVWSIAAVGAIYTVTRSRLPGILQSRWVYTSLFVFMGWTFIVRIGEIVSNLSRFHLILLLAGGAAYSIGALVYAFKRPNPIRGLFGFHEIWHTLVLLGFSFHYFLVLDFYL